MTPPQGSRLDSWKEIAEYLSRNVRTVTRWADERGLPIHHVPGGKRGHVFAFTAELDAWLLSQRTSLPAASLPSSFTGNRDPLSDLAPAALASAQAVVAAHADIRSGQSTQTPRHRFSRTSLRWRIALMPPSFLPSSTIQTPWSPRTPKAILSGRVVIPTPL